MAFNNPTVTDPGSVLQALDTFLTTTLGWTQHRAYASGGGFPQELIVGDGTGKVYGFIADNGPSEPEIRARVATGFVASASYNAQTEVALNDARMVGLSTSILNCWMFANDTAGQRYCHIVCEVSTGQYRHFSFGTLNKWFPFSGGEYMAGQNLTDLATANGGLNYIYLSGSNFNTSGTDGGTNHIGFAADDGTRLYQTTANTGFLSAIGSFNTPTIFSGDYPWYPILFFGQSTFSTTNIPILCEIYAAISSQENMRRAIPGARAQTVGTMPDVRLCNLNGITPANTFVVGTGTWRAFPVRQKAGTFTTLNNGSSGHFSGDLGVAYLQ